MIQKISMRNTRISLLIVTVLLISIGIVMIFSSSAIYAYEKFGDSNFFLKRHILYFFIGIIATVLVMSIDVSLLRKIAKPMLFAGIVLLLLLLLLPGFGEEVSGAKRWIKVCGFSFQPSEAVKLALIFYVADFLSKKRAQKVTSLFPAFLPLMIITGLIVGLVLIQPDLGTAVALSAVIGLMFFVSGIKITHLISIILLSLPVLYKVIFMVEYRRKRITAFLNPWSDPRGDSFQIIQSFIALGSGGLFGVGLGQSRQKLFYLPASHTDFIFSIIGEELGLIGTAGLLLLFALFIWNGLKIVFNAKSSFEQLFSLGIVFMIGLEVIVNIGVSTGLLPTKGLPLPFISYGGTSLIFKMMSVGLLLNVAKEKVTD